MGAFCVILNQRQLSIMVKLLIDKIKVSIANRPNLLTQIQCFSQIGRSVGNKIPKELIKEIFPILND